MMEIKLNQLDLAKAIYVYLALKGQNADISSIKTGVKKGLLEYLVVDCTSFEREIDPIKLHKLVKKGEL